jgi:hypothetical protein
MELYIRLTTRAHPRIRARVVVLVIILVTVIVLWLAGCGLPAALTAVLGASATAARTVLPRVTSRQDGR